MKPWSQFTSFLLWFLLGFAGFLALQTQSEQETFTSDYYPLLGEAFLRGQCYLPKEPPRELLNLSNPYDPAQSKVVHNGYGLFDMSYRKGRLYLYFGPTPALLAFAPWEAVTGRRLSQPKAIVFFCALGFAAGALLLELTARRLQLGWRFTWPLQAGYAILCGALILVRRPEVYEVAIASGFAFSGLSLLFLGRVCLRQGGALLNLLLLGLCAALAAGSRPILLPGLALVCAGAAYHAFNYAEGGLRRRLARPLLLATVLAAGLGALAAYNVVRFGDPLEFGLSYQIGGNPMLGHRLLSTRVLPYNLSVFLWQLPELDRCYPFLFLPDPQWLPSLDDTYIHYANEGVHGLLIVCPLLLVCLPLCLALRRAGRFGDSALGALYLWVFTLGVTNLLLIGCFAWIAPRYLLEFQPWLVLLSLLLMLALQARPRPQPSAQAGVSRLQPWLVRLTWSAFAASVALSYLQSAGWALYVSSERSAEVRVPAKVLNPLLLRVFGPGSTAYGPRTLRLVLTPREAGTCEPLLTWWQQAKTKGFFLKHLGQGRACLQYKVNEDLFAESQSFQLQGPETHQFTFLAGALLPHSTDMRLLRLEADQVSVLLSKLRVEMDGQVIMDAQLPRSTSPARRLFVQGVELRGQ